MLGLLLKGAADELCELVDLTVRVRVDRLKVTYTLVLSGSRIRASRARGWLWGSGMAEFRVQLFG